MSYTEIHIGELVEVKFQGSIEDYCKEFCKAKGIIEKEPYNYTWEEEFRDRFSDTLFIHRNKIYIFQNHKEYEDYEDIAEAWKDGDKIKFITQHYNGGASFGEVLEEALDKL